MKNILLLLLFAFGLTGYAQIVFTPQTTFHSSSYGSTYGTLESTNSPDNGGLLTMFIANNGAVSDSITAVKVSNTQGAVVNPVGTLLWPPVMQSAGAGLNLSALLIKGDAVPLRENDTVTVEVYSAQGGYAQQAFINRTPQLRIANIIPSADKKTLFVYLRNQAQTACNITGVVLNTTTYTPGNSPELTAVAGNYNVSPGGVAIFAVKAATAYSELTPLMLRIQFAFQGAIEQYWVSSFQRFVSAEFPIGTWSSSLYNSNHVKGRKSLRNLNISSVIGPGSYNLMQQANEQYHFYTMREANFDSAGSFSNTPAINEVSTHAADEWMHYWIIDDEPDLNGKNTDEQLIKNMTYWKYDNNTPSYVNLAVQKKFQRYGWYADVVSMDHYCDDGAPNVLPLSWIPFIGRKGSVDEAVEYTQQLKLNTEPKRMYSWCQLAAGTWNTQPEPYIDNYQFWAHVMSGAKGIHFFVAQPNTSTDFPDLYAEAQLLTSQLNTIKTLCLYGEPSAAAQVTNGNIKTLSLTGHSAVVVTCFNNTIDFTYSGSATSWDASIAQASGDIAINLPNWIDTANIYEVTAQGKRPVTGLTSLGNGNYTLHVDMNGATRTFVFGKQDTVAPDAPGSLVWADLVAPNKVTLSWKEPWDNFGVKGYYIIADGRIVDSVRYPIWDAGNAPGTCNTSTWQIAAFDDAGNVSAYANIAPPAPFVGTGTPVIYTQPVDVTISAGAWADFHIADSASTFTGYCWQTDSGKGVWTNLVTAAGYTGIYTPHLKVLGTSQNNDFKFRCAVTAGCNGAPVFSSAALLSVTGLGIGTADDAYFNIIPNPNNGKFNLAFTGISEPFNLRIVDLAGRTILADRIYTNNVTINLANAAPGLYLAIVTANALMIQKKILIK